MAIIDSTDFELPEEPDFPEEPELPEEPSRAPRPRIRSPPGACRRPAGRRGRVPGAGTEPGAGLSAQPGPGSRATMTSALRACVAILGVPDVDPLTFPWHGVEPDHVAPPLHR